MQSNWPEIRAVGFDLGETLMCYEGIPLNWQSRYREALTAVGNACYPPSLAVSLTEGDLARAEAILARHNTRLTPRTTEISSAHILEEAFFYFFRQTYKVYDDTLPTLLALRESGLKIGVLTDVPYGMSRRFVERDLAPIAPYLDTSLTSVEVGCRKPAVNGFLALAAHCGVAPDTMVYAGNEAKDIVGANAAGMRSVLLVRDNAPVPDYGQSRTVSSLLELTTVLFTG